MIYVTSDLHGYPLDKLKDFLAKVGFGRDDELYILGDVIDRGPDGVRILQWIMAQPNVKLLLGNHESMMLSCETALFDFESENVSVPLGTRAEKLGLWLSNSGDVTFHALLAVRSREVEAILRFLHTVPLYAQLTVDDRRFVLVHGGLEGFSSDRPLSDYPDRVFLWSRPNLWTQYYDDATVILGHTPTLFYGDQYTGRILKTRTWIDVDVGVGLGQEPVLLRLDDMKEFYYKEIKNALNEKQINN